MKNDVVISNQFDGVGIITGHVSYRGRSWNYRVALENRRVVVIPESLLHRVLDRIALLDQQLTESYLFLKRAEQI